MVNLMSVMMNGELVLQSEQGMQLEYNYFENITECLGSTVTAPTAVTIIATIILSTVLCKYLFDEGSLTN